MHVQVKLFAILRELKGQSELELEVPAGTTVAGLQEALFPLEARSGRFPRSMLYAVNREYAPLDRELRDGDEVAFVPPVSGG